MRKYKIIYKTSGGFENDIFDDVQWKDYGVRAKQDKEGGLHRIIPYFSIYYIDIINVEDNP